MSIQFICYLYVFSPLVCLSFYKRQRSIYWYKGYVIIFPQFLYVYMYFTYCSISLLLEVIETRKYLYSCRALNFSHPAHMGLLLTMVYLTYNRINNICLWSTSTVHIKSILLSVRSSFPACLNNVCFFKFLMNMTIYFWYEI